MGHQMLPEIFDDPDGNRWAYHMFYRDKLALLWEDIDRWVEFLPEITEGYSEETELTWSYVNDSDQALIDAWYSELVDGSMVGIVRGAVGPVYQYGMWRCWMKVSGYPLPSSPP